MGKAAPPATPPRPVRNTASWSGTAYSSGQARLISQLTLISGGRSPIRHVGTRRVGDGRPTVEVEAVRTRKVNSWAVPPYMACRTQQIPDALYKINLDLHMIVPRLLQCLALEQFEVPCEDCKQSQCHYYHCHQQSTTPFKFPVRMNTPS